MIHLSKIVRTKHSGSSYPREELVDTSCFHVSLETWGASYTWGRPRHRKTLWVRFVAKLVLLLIWTQSLPSSVVGTTGNLTVWPCHWCCVAKVTAIGVSLWVLVLVLACTCMWAFGFWVPGPGDSDSFWHWRQAPACPQVTRYCFTKDDGSLTVLFTSLPTWRIYLVLWQPIGSSVPLVL